MMALKAVGVTEVYVTDVMQKRLDKAMELGATGVINSREEDPIAKIMELTDGRGVDLAIECSGAEICANQCIEMLIKGGTMVQVAYSGKGTMTLNTSLLCDKEITIKTVFRYRHIYPMAIQAVSEGKINLKGIVTDVFDLDDAQNAMDRSVHDKADIVKAVIRI